VSAFAVAMNFEEQVFMTFIEVLKERRQFIIAFSTAHERIVPEDDILIGIVAIMTTLPV
jgi:hypothetical protein